MTWGSAIVAWVLCGLIFVVGWATASLVASRRRQESIDRLLALCERWGGRAMRARTGGEAGAYTKARVELLREVQRIEDGPRPEPRRLAR